MNSKKFLNLFCAIFLIVGIVFVVFGIFSQISTSKFLKTAVKTNATITNIIVSRDSDGDLYHNVSVSFVADGKVYEGTLNEYNSNMYVGGSTTIYYNPDNPDNFIGNGGKSFNYIFIVLGFAFISVAILVMYRFAKKKQEKFRLQKEGICLTAKISNIHKDFNCSYNGRNPDVIECSCAVCPKDGSLELLPDNKYGAKFICLDDDYRFDPQNWDDEKYLDDLIDEFFNYIDYNFDEWV